MGGMGGTGGMGVAWLCSSATFVALRTLGRMLAAAAGWAGVCALESVGWSLWAGVCGLGSVGWGLLGWARLHIVIECAAQPRPYAVRPRQPD